MSSEPAESPRGPFNPAGDPLALDAETMRALGHQTVDALVDMLVDPATPALRRATPDGDGAADRRPRLPAAPRDVRGAARGSCARTSSRS